MRVLLVMPSIRERATLYERLLMKLTAWAPLTLHQIAACTPAKHEVVIIDENYRNVDFSGDYDIVGISAMTATAPRAYRIADEFRARGIPVVLGGYHPTAMPQEAKQHADAVVMGEAEGVWFELLKDAERGMLKPFYTGFSNHLVSPLKNSGTILGYVEASRGCMNRCAFCAISGSPMGRFRKKPVDMVVREIESMKNKGFVFFDSSMTMDIDYTKELFRRIRHAGKRFACFGNAAVLARDDDLLEIAHEAGCVAWAVGFESVSQHAMDSIGKKSNRVEEYGMVVKKVNEHGMALVGSFVFGFDDDTPDIFDTTMNLVYKWNMDSIAVNILTPLPGTPLFNSMEKEGRLITKDWSKYDLYHVVHRPAILTPDEIYEGVEHLVAEFFSAGEIMKRLLGKHFDFVTRSALAYHLCSSKLGYRLLLQHG